MPSRRCIRAMVGCEVGGPHNRCGIKLGTQAPPRARCRSGRQRRNSRTRPTQADARLFGIGIAGHEERARRRDPVSVPGARVGLGVLQLADQLCWNARNGAESSFRSCSAPSRSPPHSAHDADAGDRAMVAIAVRLDQPPGSRSRDCRARRTRAAPRSGLGARRAHRPGRWKSVSDTSSTHRSALLEREKRCGIKFRVHAPPRVGLRLTARTMRMQTTERRLRSRSNSTNHSDSRSRDCRAPRTRTAPRSGLGARRARPPGRWKSVSDTFFNLPISIVEALLTAAIRCGGGRQVRASG